MPAYTIYFSFLRNRGQMRSQAEKNRLIVRMTGNKYVFYVLIGTYNYQANLLFMLSFNCPLFTFSFHFKFLNHNSNCIMHRAKAIRTLLSLLQYNNHTFDVSSFLFPYH